VAQARDRALGPNLETTVRNFLAFSWKEEAPIGAPRDRGAAKPPTALGVVGLWDQRSHALLDASHRWGSLFVGTFFANRRGIENR
jgi:hypothetical protein